ncbi:MAG: DNA transposition protein [Rhodospirillales bacterium]|nr:DNA transposition protein [Rhodospirillales bacterium]
MGAKGKARHDNKTLDLLSWTPKVPKVAHFKEEDVRAANLGSKVSKAVSKTLSDTKKREKQPLDRKEVATEMAAYLGEDVSKDILDRYSSESSETHKISVVRALALMYATDDYRLLSLMAAEVGLAVIPKRFECAVEEAILAEKIEEMRSDLSALRKGRRK